MLHFDSLQRALLLISFQQRSRKIVVGQVSPRYTVYEDLLLEEFIVYKKMSLSVIEQEFTLHGVEYVLNEDGSIGFYNGETLMFSIPKPVMYELGNPEKKSYGLHYEIIQEKDSYLLILHLLLCKV